MNNIKNSFKLQILFNIKNYNVWLFSGIHDLKKNIERHYSDLFGTLLVILF